MKDVLGQEITVGCTILHGSGGGRGNYAGFSPEVVKKLTPKMVGVDTRYAWDEKKLRYLEPKNVVVIDKLIDAEDS